MDSKKLINYEGVNKIDSMKESLPVLAKHYNNLHADVEAIEAKTDLITSAGAATFDTISEKTDATGVTIDGVLLKDSEVTTDVINEKTDAAGVTIDSVLLKDNTVTASDVISTYVTTDNIRESTENAGVTIEGVIFKAGRGISLSANVTEYIAEVTIPNGIIVGTDVGDLGHSGGAELVSAPASGYALEFISAVLIYDYAGAAFTGAGGNDLAIRVGTTVVSPAIADTDLLTASGDQVVHLRALSAADYDLPVGSNINLKSTAVTQPGLPEIFTLEVTAAEDTGGSVEVTLDGVLHNIPVTADTAAVNAGEIQVYIHNLQGYTASVDGAIVTVTAATDGAQTDATFGAGTANSITATVTVTQQGVDAATGAIRAHVNYRVHATGL